MKQVGRKKETFQVPAVDIHLLTSFIIFPKAQTPANTELYTG